MKKKKYIIVLSIFFIVSIYFICESIFFGPFTGIRFIIWEWEHRDTDQTMIILTGNSTLYEEDTSGFEEYLNPDEMAFSWAEEEDDYLMILGENYSRSYFNHEDGIYSNGPMGFYNGAVIVMVEPEKEEIVKEIEISAADGKVIYMDQTKYGLMKHEKVQFYEISSGEMVKEEIIDGFVRDEIYNVDISGFQGELEISRAGEVIYRTKID